MNITLNRKNKVCRFSPVLSRSTGAGFYSVLHFCMNNYIYCKKQRVDFSIESNNWLFKYKEGWTDYFEDNKMTFSENIHTYNNRKMYNPNRKTIGDYQLFEYKNIIQEFYRYNEHTKRAILDAKIKYNIPEKPEIYDSIFIRRGDKLIFKESNYIHSSKYLELLLQKNPVCKIVFLQTDDYNCYLELLEYINEKKYNIELITMCDEKTKGGMIIFDVFKNELINVNSKNENENKETSKYISNVFDNLFENKSVDKMTPDEIYEHTIKMIVGIDIVMHSNICVTDYTSNVSRFIKLAHDNFEKVYDVLNPDTQVDMNKFQCPCYGF